MPVSQVYQGIADTVFSGLKGERPAPKPGAIPTSLYPDIHFSAMIPRRAVKIKFFLSVVISVVKAAFVPFSAIGGNPANAGVTRLCGVLPHPIPDTTTALPNQARYQLRHTRIFNFCHDTTAGKKIKDFSVCGHSCGQSRFQQPEKILPSPVLQGFPAFRLAPSRIPPRHSQTKRDADSLFLDGEYYYSRSKHACPAPFSAFSAYGRVS